MFMDELKYISMNNEMYQMLFIKCYLSNVIYHSVVKLQPKLLLWPMTTDADNPMNQSEYEWNISSGRQAPAGKRVRVSHNGVLEWRHKN